MFKSLAVILLPLGLLLIAPAEAWAWGVGVHLQVGSWLLDQGARLPLPLQALLAASSRSITTPFFIPPEWA